MPVTAKLSKAFYDRLGDDVANELVEWFNSVDFAYRSDLRDINDRNYERFDAKLEQRFAESMARSDVKFAEAIAHSDRKFAEALAHTDVKFAEAMAHTDAKFAEAMVHTDAKFAEAMVHTDAKFAEAMAHADAKFAEAMAHADKRFAELHVTLERGLKEQTKWMFVAWATLLIPIVGFGMRH